MIAKSHRVNMLEGSLPKNILRFAYPLMIANVLSLIYHMADMMVVGQFAKEAENGLAALSAIAPVSALISPLLSALPVGVSVLTSQSIGAGDRERTHRVVHTGVTLGFITGAVSALTAFLLCRSILVITNAPPETVDIGTMYCRIVCLQYFSSAVTQSCSVVLAAAGYSRGIMTVSITSGFLNLLLNLLFVCGFHWDMAGVAVATVISSMLAAFTFLGMLCRANEVIKVYLRRLRIHGKETLAILKLSFPAWLQLLVLQCSNVYVQVSLNSLPHAAIVCAGNSAGANVEMLIHAAIGAIATANINFIGQNVGAKNYLRVRQINRTASLLVLFIGGAISALLVLFARPILSLYNSNPAVIDAGMTRVLSCGVFMVLNILADVQLGGLRGLSRSLSPTVITLVASVGVRMMWLYVVFGAVRTLPVLYLCYPVSYTVCLLLGVIVFRRTLRKDTAAAVAQSSTLSEPGAPIRAK